jgi:ribonuclease/clavin/mitogillin
MNILNVGYDSTNYYMLIDKHPKLLVDVGWSNTLLKLQHQCRRYKIAVTDLPYLLITHYHPDHAGLAQELKQLGVKLILMETQVDAVPRLKTYMKPENRYIDIDLSDNIYLTLQDNRAFLARIGIAGEIISTPGHSDDSITLVLDKGAAFTGDLSHPLMAANDITQASWTKIRALNARTVYPGHGPTLQLSANAALENIDE